MKKEKSRIIKMKSRKMKSRKMKLLLMVTLVMAITFPFFNYVSAEEPVKLYYDEELPFGWYRLNFIGESLLSANFTDEPPPYEPNPDYSEEENRESYEYGLFIHIMNYGGIDLTIDPFARQDFYDRFEQQGITEKTVGRHRALAAPPIYTEEEGREEGMYYYYIEADSETGTGVLVNFMIKRRGETSGTFNYYENKVDELLLNIRFEAGERDDAGAVIIDTGADETPGEMPFSVPAAIVLGAAAMAAAAVGASGAGGSGEDKTGEPGSTYRMILYKDFGNKIRYNSPLVFVYARMVEIDHQGTEIARPDLTEMIQILTYDKFIHVSNTGIQGDYMAASVTAQAEGDANLAQEGIISFRFTGEGGVFQNNVKFQMIGESQIRFPEGNSLFVLAGSGDSYSLPYQLIYFMEDPRVTVNCFQDNTPFELSLEMDEKGNRTIAAVDREQDTASERFYNSFTCEIIAENEKEYARSLFDVVLCYEGVMADFAGREQEIKVYPEENKEMPETPVVFKAGIWNEETQRLEMYRPENFTINITGPGNIVDLLEVEHRLDQDYRREDSIRYLFKAGKPLPSVEPVECELEFSCEQGEEQFENKTALSLVPEKLTYSEKFEEEYQNCLHIINNYVPEEMREQKLKQLEETLHLQSVEDLRETRTIIWEYARDCILKEAKDYMDAANWYDTQIYRLEWVVWVGDIAFGLAIKPLGGPITAFILKNVKKAFIDLCAMISTKPSIGYDEVMGFVAKRITYIMGQGDAVFKPPKANEYKKLAAWLAGFALYRIVYHWFLEKDEYGKSKGLVQSVKDGLWDMTASGISTMLEGYVKDSIKGKGWDTFMYDDAGKEYNAISATVHNIAVYLELVNTAQIDWTVNDFN